MGNFKIKNRYLAFCYEFRLFIRCMKAAFYRPDYQKFLMCLLIKRLGRAFVSKHAVEPLKRSVELLKHSAKNFETLGRAFETRSRASEDLREN